MDRFDLGDDLVGFLDCAEGRGADEGARAMEPAEWIGLVGRVLDDSGKGEGVQRLQQQCP